MNKHLIGKALVSQDIERLKGEGRFFQAGALSAVLGFASAHYGCHYGMRSTREAAIAAYAEGFEQASKELRSVK